MLYAQSRSCEFASQALPSWNRFRYICTCNDSWSVIPLMFSKAVSACEQTSDNQITRVGQGLICALTSSLQEPVIPSLSPLKLRHCVVDIMPWESPVLLPPRGVTWDRSYTWKHLRNQSYYSSSITIGRFLIVWFNEGKLGQIMNPIIAMVNPIPYYTIRARLFANLLWTQELLAIRN